MRDIRQRVSNNNSTSQKPSYQSRSYAVKCVNYVAKKYIIYIKVNCIHHLYIKVNVSELMKYGVGTPVNEMDSLYSG